MCYFSADFDHIFCLFKQLIQGYVQSYFANYYFLNFCSSSVKKVTTNKKIYLWISEFLEEIYAGEYENAGFTLSCRNGNWKI